MSKELPILECVDNYTKEMNYLVLALTAYKATVEVMFDRLINVTIACQFSNQCGNFKATKKSNGVIKHFLLCLEKWKYISNTNARGIS